MQAFKLKLLESVAPETVFEKMKPYIQAYKKVEGATPKIIGGYDQKSTPFCTAFGAAGCTTYNTGQVFTNEYIDSWASKYITPNGVASMMTIASLFAKEHGCQTKAIILTSLDAKVLLDSGYALVVSTIAPAGFWKRGVTTGKATGAFTGDTFQHTVYMFRDNGKDYLGNSWNNYVTLGYHNTIEVNLQDMLIRKYIRPTAIVIYKK